MRVEPPAGRQIKATALRLTTEPEKAHAAPVRETHQQKVLSEELRFKAAACQETAVLPRLPLHE